MTPDWMKTSVFYQIYPRSFSDSDGDGTGDLRGIIEKLDHLDWLGVNAVWLSPHYPSPKHDGGYDVADYTAVDPQYGTLDDFRELLDEMHRRDMKLVIDVVLNHTSDEHSWFQQSRSSRDSPKRDWYVWHDGVDGGPPNNWFSTFGGSAWEYDAQTDAYYYHFFLKEQPDLNWRNPEVQRAMFDQMRFWFDLGVDGLRLDAIGTVFEREDLRDHGSDYDSIDFLRAFWLGKQMGLTVEEVDAIGASLYSGQKDLPEIQDLMADLRSLCDEYDDRVLIGETNSPEFFGSGTDRLHAIFDFNLLGFSELTPARVRDDQRYWLSQVPDGCVYGNTLNNHDQSRVRTHYGDGEHDEAWAHVSAALMLTMVGVPFLYYGEEIGMEDYNVRSYDEVHDVVSLVYRDMMRSEGKPDSEILDELTRLSRDRCRTPMQWSAESNAGFSPAEVDTWLPVHENRLDGVNVQDQLGQPDSLLHLYRRLIALRRGSPALMAGSYEDFDAGNDEILAFQRKAPAQKLLVLINFSHQREHLDEALPAGMAIFSTDAETLGSGTQLSLAPFEVRVLELD